MLSFVNDFGFGVQYFRRKDQIDIKSFAGTAIVLQRIATIAYIIICLVALTIAGFQSAITFTLMMLSKALAMWFAIHSAEFYRAFRYKTEAIINLCLISLAIAVIVLQSAELKINEPLLLCAIIYITMNLSSVFVFLIVKNNFFEREFRPDFARSMMKSGVAFFFDNFVTRYRQHVENIILATFLNRSDLALVSRAKTIVSAPHSIINSTLRNPLLSILRSTDISIRQYDIAVITLNILILIIGWAYLFLFIPMIADYLGPVWVLTISFAIELAPYLCLLTFLGLARIVAISNSQEARVAQSALLELLVLLPCLALVLLVNKIQLVPTVMIISVSSALLMMIFSIKDNIMIGRRLGYSIAITISAIALMTGDQNILFVLIVLFSLYLLIKIKKR